MKMEINRAYLKETSSGDTTTLPCVSEHKGEDKEVDDNGTGRNMVYLTCFSRVDHVKYVLPDNVSPILQWMSGLIWSHRLEYTHFNMGETTDKTYSMWSVLEEDFRYRLDTSHRSLCEIR